MSSMPSLSWQSVAIGDPLYRPFKVGLREQLKQSSDKVFGIYANIREINRILAEEGIEEAREEEESCGAAHARQAQGTHSNSR